MKESFRAIYAYGILFIIMISFSFQGCSTSNRIFSENDIVNSAKRLELKYSIRDRDRRSPLLYFTQSIVKEINARNEISYTAYDVLSLSASSFTPDEKAIIITDNEVYTTVIDKMELDNIRNISENTTNILTSDSTNLSVVTGYSEKNRKIVRFSYKIPLSTISKIKDSDQFSLRYYCGPSMLTIKPKRKSIKKIKQLIDNT
jgi:hypothetical protein